MKHINKPSEQLKKIRDEIYHIATKRFKTKDDYNRMDELYKELDKLEKEGVR